MVRSPTSTSAAPDPAPAAPAARSRRLPRRARNALLTAHIIVSVGLLGDSAGFLAVAIRAATTADPALAAAAHELLRMFSLVFGIPLSFATLATGLALAVGGGWDVLRTPWVAAKLLLILSAIAVGALVLDPALTAAEQGAGGGGRALILGSAYDVVALAAATALSVFKPGGRRRRRRTR